MLRVNNLLAQQVRRTAKLPSKNTKVDLIIKSTKDIRQTVEASNAKTRPILSSNATNNFRNVSTYLPKVNKPKFFF